MDDVKEISKLSMGREDTLVVRALHAITGDVAENLRRQMEAKFPGHKIVVLSEGLSLEVLRDDSFGTAEASKEIGDIESRIRTVFPGHFEEFDHTKPLKWPSEYPALSVVDTMMCEAARAALKRARETLSNHVKLLSQIENSSIVVARSMEELRQIITFIEGARKGKVNEG